MSAPELANSAFWFETNDAPILHHDLTLADLAHVIHLAERALLPFETAKTLLLLLIKLDADAEFKYDPEIGDAFSNRLRWLDQRAPEAARSLSTGRARREATTVAFRLRVRRDLLTLARAVGRFQNALLDQSERHVETVMPDYTYLQPAQPTSLAHYLLSFVYPLQRDQARLREAFQITNQSPAGIGSTNGSRLPLDRGRLAELLAFDAVIPNARDAMWQVDVPIGVMNAATTLLLHADRLAEDLQIFSTNEFGFVTLGDEYSRPSVIMPQKKNPYSLAFVRGAAGSLIGNSTETYIIARTPSGQVDNRLFAHGQVPRALDLSIRSVDLMAGVVGSLQVCPEHMAHAVEKGFTQAADLAEVIMQAHRLDYQSAHRVIGNLVQQLQGQGKTAQEITPQLLEKSAQHVLGRSLTMNAAELKALLDPKSIIESRTGTGGAAPARVREMIADCRANQAAQYKWIDETAARIAQAEERLFRMAKEFGERHA